MNKIYVEIENCRNCTYCSHNGLVQCQPDYICHHIDVRGRNKIDTKYWRDMPILAVLNQKTSKFIAIPDWCPRLGKVETNDR